MMGNTSTKWIEMSDAAILDQLGSFVKYTRTHQNKTQAQFAEMADLNRWTVSRLENGGYIKLSSLIQVLRALDSLYVLNTFEFKEEISPLPYAKLKKRPKEHVRNRKTDDKVDLGW